MKRLGLLLLPILAITLMLGGNAFAQPAPGDGSYYFVTYYSNANTSGAPDGTLRLINDGEESTGSVFHSLWAAIYVFDDSQEMRSCCACYISANGLLSESVNKELTANEFTGRGEMTRGVLKVISSYTNDPTDPVPDRTAGMDDAHPGNDHHVSYSSSRGLCKRRGEGPWLEYRRPVSRLESHGS